MSSPVSVPSAGVLARGGSAIVHALVYHHPTPQHAPASFENLIDAIPADDASGAGGGGGGIRDWQLSLRKLLAHRGDHVHDVWTAFETWRRTYVAERLVGDVATVRAFLAWGDKVTDVTALHPLNLGTARIDAKVAPRVAWQVLQAETTCVQGGYVGLGVSAPQRAGVVRGFVTGDEPLLLLADGDASVSAVRSGLEVVDPTLTSLPGGLLVHGWVVGADGVTAISDEGPVELGTSVGGRLLAQVAPGVAQASVGPVSLGAVFAPLFLALRESAQLAASDHVPLYIRTGPAGH